MINPAPMDPPDIHELQWGGVQGDMGWDIGANVGQSVEEMLERFDLVMAFEPAVESYHDLDAYWQGHPGVRLFNQAVSAQPGQVELSVRRAPIFSGQLVTKGMPYHGEDYGQNSADWGPEDGTRTVQCTTLDQIYATYGLPDFVKVDTEGHELEVLRGGPHLLAAGTVKWLIEFHDEHLQVGCQRLLEDAGYAVTMIRHPHYEYESQMWRKHGWLRA